MYTVNVRKPDVRFSNFWEVVRFLNCPVIGWCLKSGHKCPVFGPSGPFTFQRPVFECPVPNRPNRPKPVRNRFQTGSKPVWNRFWHLVDRFQTKTGSEPVPNRFRTSRTSEIRTILSGYRTFGQLASSEILTKLSGFRMPESIRAFEIRI